MDKLIFERDVEFDDEDDDDREASKIIFELPNGLNIFEYKIACIRMARAIGFLESTIQTAFGVEYNLTDELSEHYEMNDLLTYTGSSAQLN